MTKLEIKKPYLKMIESTVINIGFTKTKERGDYIFIKNFDNGFAKIVPLVWVHGLSQYISISCSLRLSDVQTIINPFVDVVESAYNTSATISAGLRDLNIDENGEIKVDSVRELEQSIVIINNALQNEVLNFFDSFKTISDLDIAINKENRPNDLFCNEVSERPFIGITSAVINKNPQLKYWENYYRLKLKNANQHIKNQYEKLVEYLKNNYPGSLA